MASYAMKICRSQSPPVKRMVDKTQGTVFGCELEEYHPGSHQATYYSGKPDPDFRIEWE